MNLLKRILILLPIVMLAIRVVVAAPNCQIACYVDSTTGSDTNDGQGPATALKTIQAGVNRAVAHGTIFIAPGDYPENVVIQKDSIKLKAS